MPISDLKRILEILASQNHKNISPVDIAEAVRPAISGTIDTANSSFEQPTSYNNLLSRIRTNDS